jgi:hypothetical protein
VERANASTAAPTSGPARGAAVASQLASACAGSIVPSAPTAIRPHRSAFWTAV